MKISGLSAVLPILWKAKVSPMLWGGAGLGKSEAVTQIAHKDGRDIVILNLGSQEVGDLLGILVENKKTGQAVYQLPEWFPTDPDSRTIIFLDEINRAPRYVLQAIFPLVLEGRLHRAFLPPGCRVVAAANPPTDDYTVTDTSDEALMTRFCHLRVTNDVDEWYEYAKGAGVPDVVRSFALEQRTLFQAKDFELPRFKPMFRSLSAMGRIESAGLPDEFLLDVATGVFGPEIGVTYLAHKKDFAQGVRGIDVLNNFKKTEARLKKLAADGTRNDVLYNTGLDVLIEGDKLEQLSSTQLENFRKFTKVLPLDLMIGFLFDMLKRPKLRNQLLNDTDLTAYVRSVPKEVKNSTLEKLQTEMGKKEEAA